MHKELSKFIGTKVSVPISNFSTSEFESTGGPIYYIVYYDNQAEVMVHETFVYYDNISRDDDFKELTEKVVG